MIGLNMTNTFPAQPEQRPSSSVAKSFAKVIVSVVFSIIAFGLYCALIALVSIRPDNFTRIIEKVDVTQVLEEAGLDDVIVSEINNSSHISENISTNDLDDFLKRETVSTEIGMMAAKYAKAIAEGDLSYYIKPQDIKDFLKAVEPDIREQFNYSLTGEDYDEIVGVVEEHIDLQDYQVDKVLEDTEVDTTLPSVVFSAYPLIITGILCILLVFDIFMLHRKKIRTAFITGGIPAILAGLVYIAAGVLFGPYHGLPGNAVLNSVKRYTGGIADLLLSYGLVCLASGVLAIVVFFIIAGVRKEFVPKDRQGDKRALFRMTGLFVNIALLAACAVVSLLYYSSVA